MLRKITRTLPGNEKRLAIFLRCPCVSRVSSVCTDMFFSLFYFNADLQYMVKSYIWTAVKISGLNLSGVGLNATMITSAWCSTKSTTKATILCKKTTTTTTDKQNKKTIKIWQHCKKWQKWPFGRPLVRQNHVKSPILGLQFKFNSKNTRNTNRITAGNKYVWTAETFFKYCAKKAPCKTRVKLPFFFYFSRRSFGFVVGKLLLLKNEYPCTIHHSHKKSKVSTSWFLTRPINSLRYFCYICGLFRAHFSALSPLSFF